MNAALRNLFTISIILFFAILSTGCGANVGSFKSLYIDGDGVREITDTDTGPSDEKLKFCSPLSFEKVVWNQSMGLRERRSFAIALSISGRFEGRSGWTNLTNNFDGQGMSAGLLNQTLGTESLQPLLWQMRTNHSGDFSTSFSSTNDASISEMLETWKTSKTLNKTEDVEGWHPSELVSKSISSRAANSSVQWAVNQLYKSNGDFKPEWKEQIQSLLKKPAYVSLQISAAEKIHTKALTYVKRVGINDLRTYLLMFDFVVQNGSISEARFKEWESEVQAEKLTSTVEILKKLVEVRLQDSKPEWVPDVRSRKYALIDGLGKVHGENLDLMESYCYESADLIL